MSLQNPTPEEDAACLALIGQTVMPPCGGESPASKERRQRLRDEFAMAALTGVLVSMADIVSPLVAEKRVASATEAMAVMAYELADSMLAAREL